MKDMIVKVRNGLVVLMCFWIFGCVTTEEFNGARELNRADDDMQNTLIQLNTLASDLKNSQRELLQDPSNNSIKKGVSELEELIEQRQESASALAGFARQKAESLASANHNHLAIGFYRIAALGYWKDGIDTQDNNKAFFVSINNAKALCEKMGDKAPDRDCFFLAFTPLLAGVEETLKNPSLLGFRATESSQSVIEEVRRFSMALARENDQSVDAGNGTLTNLINLAIQRQSFLSNHPSMATYICRQIKRVSGRYIGIVATLAKNRLTDEAVIKDENPFYARFLSFDDPGTANSIEQRTSALINNQISLCK